MHIACTVNHVNKRLFKQRRSVLDWNRGWFTWLPLKQQQKIYFCHNFLRPKIILMHPWDLLNSKKFARSGIIPMTLGFFANEIVPPKEKKVFECIVLIHFLVPELRQKKIHFGMSMGFRWVSQALCRFLTSMEKLLWMLKLASFLLFHFTVTQENSNLSFI